MAAHQAPLSLGFSRQEHWSGLPFSSLVHESEKWKWSRKSCPTLSDPMDCSLPGSSFHGICQAKVLEWGAIAFSKRNYGKTQFQQMDCRALVWINSGVKMLMFLQKLPIHSCCVGKAVLFKGTGLASVQPHIWFRILHTDLFTCSRGRTVRCSRSTDQLLPEFPLWFSSCTLKQLNLAPSWWNAYRPLLLRTDQK